MKRGTLGLVVCLGAFCGMLGAAEAPKDAAKPATGTPKIKFDQTVYDFGKTSQVDHVSGIFTFQNVGDGVLKLGRPTTTCGCTVAGVKPDVLQPGEKGELAFNLNLPKTRATLHKQITVESNDPQAPRTVLTVKVDYTPLYEMLPLSFNVNIHKGDSSNITARVTRSDGKNFNISRLKPSQPWIQATAEPDPKSTNGAVLVQATLKPEGTPRYFSENIVGYVEGSEQPAFTVTLFGRLVGDLTLSPESLYWPITDPGKALTTRRIIVKSAMPNQSLELKNVSSSLKEVNVEAVSKDDGKTFEVIAKLASVPPKTTNGVIRFETNLPSQSKVEVPVYINIVRR